MGLVHELHVVVIVSEVQGIVCKQLRKTVNYSDTAQMKTTCAVYSAANKRSLGFIWAG